MRTIFQLILTCMFFLSAGCANNLLVKRLKDHSVTQKNTTKLKFISSESAYGGDVYFVTEDPEVIESVWTRIYSATPTNLWCACGEQSIEFYTSNTVKNPAAILILNTSDGAHLEGDLWYHLDSERKGYYGLWRCPGLDKLVSWHLRKEHERRKNGS
jgi:hypothetical protein